MPFFLIGVFAVRLPKGGAWMEWVKSVLGIMLVALAATYVRDAFPALRSAASSAARAWGPTGGVWLAARPGRGGRAPGGRPSSLQARDFATRC